jgi:hypothetical protein
MSGELSIEFTLSMKLLKIITPKNYPRWKDVEF